MYICCMLLNEKHREAFLVALNDTQEELASFKRMAHENGDMADSCDIDIFLAQQRLELIKKSLTENDIDY